MLATIPLAVIARQTRSAMLEVLGEDYVRTARAKGLAPRRVVGVHALRNALIPVVTTIGLQVGVLMAGAILTETIFSWPGIGKWMINSISRRDYPVVQGGLLLIAVIVMVVNLIVDLLYGLINPAHPPQMTDTRPPSSRRMRPIRRQMLAEFWHYFRQNRGAVIGLWVVPRPGDLIAVFAPLIAPHDPTQQYRDALLVPPVWQEGGRAELPARHRRGRPRHPLAADLRRALFAVHRRSSWWPSRWSAASRRPVCRLLRRLGRYASSCG